MIRTLQNPAFGTLLITITFLNCQPYYLVILPYWVKYSLELDSFWQAAIMTTYMTGAFVFIPFWTWLAARVGKKRTYLLSMGVAVVAFSTIVLVRSGDKVAAVLVSFCAGASGLSLNAYNFLFQSLLADIIEYDELRTGVRREAQYANMVQVFNALTSVMSVSLPLFIMDSVGFHANEDQPAKVRHTISALLGPGCAVYVALAALSFVFYPITTLVHERIRDGLDLHATGQPALDPVTGEMVLAPGSTTSVVDSDVAWFLDNFSALSSAGPSSATRSRCPSADCSASSWPGLHSPPPLLLARSSGSCRTSTATWRSARLSPWSHSPGSSLTSAALLRRSNLRARPCRGPSSTTTSSMATTWWPRACSL
ncbi:uncharacterized protein AMSG_12211 [Thecamonas trahens ATCC 50062]|uniref:Uncharacterized protein n=1 Tax=Thecamonas trahens ATCC 50062 TaxID=461836 RepID=A0A0L0DM39_THETB|nr:hypothetical protein AMSG_12211 [Thecamonas trahens ATCC 50062]KNC53389.1 hypothetical protein AMSG_12211 [Thecamonas trahens ATCC 50062]|eukprot:XP_013754487.1 hypothetical protein AMSG_12211 [Thecamonas trahens ATCC 50062]